MKIDNEKTDELEKRIFYVNTFAKQKTGELQTSLQELQTNLETAETSITNLQTGQTNQETAISTLQEAKTTMENQITQTQNSLTTLQTDLETAHTNLNELESLMQSQGEAITENTNQISTNTSMIGTHTNTLATLTTATNTNSANITTLQADLETAETSIIDHETRIDSLEENGLPVATLTQLNTNTENITALQTFVEKNEKRISALQRDFYGTNITEISDLEGQVIENEPFNHNGGSLKFTVGTKAPNGPYASIFTRINPALDSQFEGYIKLYLYNVPAGQTTTTLNLITNGTTTALTPTIDTTDNTITIPFDFITDSVFNRFDIAFTDTLLAETFLDYVEIVCTNGTNFACLNKDYAYLVFNYQSQSGNEYNYVARNEGHNHSINYFVNSIQLGMANFSQKNTLTCRTTGITYTPSNIKYSNFYQYSRNQGTFSNALSYFISARVDSDNKLLHYDGLFITAKSYLTNVYDCSFSFNGTTNKQEYCGTTYDLRAFVGTEDTFLVNMTMGLDDLPQEFIICSRFDERLYIRGAAPFLSGYLMHHKSGEIIHIPQKNANYFIKIGKGLEPKGYIQEGRTKINVYYQDFQKTKIIKKVINFNATTEMWELSNTCQVYPNIQEIHEYGVNQMFVKRNNTWRLMTRY